MTLVEAVLRQSGDPPSTAPPTRPTVLRQLSEKEDLMPPEVHAIQTQPVLATDRLARHEEPDLSDAMATMHSQDFSTSLKQRTLSSMGRLLDDYIRRTFDAFLATAPVVAAPPPTTPSSSSSRYSSSSSSSSSMAAKPPVLAGMLDGLRQEAVKLVMEFLDDRVGQDRESFLSMKRTLVKEVHNAREVTHLFLSSLEQATTQKKLESVALMQKEYGAALEREKAALGDSITRLSSSYDTLWTLHEISKKDNATLDATVKRLETELEHERDTHEKKVKKLKEDYREALDVAKNEQIFLKRAQDGTLHGDSDDEEDGGEPQPEPVCESCEKLREKLTLVESELRIANAVYNMKTAPPPKVVTESPTAVKTKKGHGMRSSMNARKGDHSGDDDDHSVSTVGGGGGARKERSKSRVSTIKVPGSVGGGSKPSSRQGTRKGSTGTTHGRPKRGGGGGGGGGNSGILSALNSARRHVNEVNDEDDDESDTESVSSTADVQPRPRPPRSKTTSFDSSMSEKSDDIDLSSMDRGHHTRGAPNFSGMVFENAEQSDAMQRVVMHFRLDPASIPAVAAALADGYINRRPPPKDDAATQTQDSVDDLLRTYLEATKEVSAMYLEASTALRESQSQVAMLEAAREDLTKRLHVMEARLRQSTDLHELQLKERNLLLVEVTDQLTVARKKLLREQRIRDHIVKHDAPVVGLDRSPQYRREYALPLLKLDHAPVAAEGSTFLTTLSSGPASAAGDWSVDDRSMSTSWSAALSSKKHTLPPAPERSPSPDGRGRRPSTTSGNSVSTASNVRRELRRSMARVAEAEPYSYSSDAPPATATSTNFVDSHSFAKQARITDEAGHRSVAIRHHAPVTSEVSEVISAINSDPRGKMSDQKMAELNFVRAQMVSILAQQVVDKKRPVLLASSKAADEQRRGRGMALRSNH